VVLKSLGAISAPASYQPQADPSKALNGEIPLQKRIVKMTKQTAIMERTDLSKLELHQVVAMAEMRGTAIYRFTKTVTELRELAISGELHSGHLEMLYDWMQEFMMHVMDAEQSLRTARRD
jgi:hypothetical protein